MYGNLRLAPTLLYDENEITSFSFPSTLWQRKERRQKSWNVSLLWKDVNIFWQATKCGSSQQRHDPFRPQLVSFSRFENDVMQMVMRRESRRQSSNLHTQCEIKINLISLRWILNFCGKSSCFFHNLSFFHVCSADEFQAPHRRLFTVIASCCHGSTVKLSFVLWKIVIKDRK